MKSRWTDSGWCTMTTVQVVIVFVASLSLTSGGGGNKWGARVRCSFIAIIIFFMANINLQFPTSQQAGTEKELSTDSQSIYPSIYFNLNCKAIRML